MWFWLGIPVGWLIRKLFVEKRSTTSLVGSWLDSTPDGVAWDYSATYNMGDTVWIPSSYGNPPFPVYYRSLVDNNRNNNPFTMNSGFWKQVSQG